jgi:hypothetical protein
LEQWDIDEFTGEIKGMLQYAPPRWTRAYMPMGKCILFRTESVKNNPEGRSLLRNAYKSYYYQTHLEEIEAIGIERDLAGLPVLEVPPLLLESDTSQLTAGQQALRTDLYKMVRQIKRNEREGVVIPSEDLPNNMGKSGYRLKLLASGGSRAIDVAGAVRRHQTDIAMTMLGEFILLGTGAVGSFALASDKTDMFSLALASWLDNICQTFTKQAIEPLMELNGYPKEVWPTMTHEDIETPNVAELGTALTHLVNAGIIRVDPEMEDRLRGWAGLPAAPKDGTAVNMAQMKMQAAAAPPPEEEKI